MDRESLLIGVDAGTSATKACVFTADGRSVAESAVPVELFHPAPGFAEQPGEVLVDSACEALRTVAAQVDPRSVAAIGLTGQMGGLVLVDERGQALSPHLSWLDGRAAAEIDRAMDEMGSRIVELGGLAPYLAPKAAWWSRAHPASFGRAASMVEAAGFLAMHLGDCDPVIDRSSSGFAGLFDVRSSEPMAELSELWGIPIELAPRIVRAGETVGRLSGEAAARTGLPSGIPIVMAPGDGPCGWLGVGAVDPGVTVDTVGTSDHVGICTARYAGDTDGGVLICLPSAVEGLWHLQGYTSGTGLTHRWFLETLGAGSDFEELETLAEPLPAGSEELVCIPHFGGRVCPYQPAVSGVFAGLTWRHRREHLYRAVLESVAYEYACYLEAARRLDPEAVPSQVRVIGGGSTSRLWTQIKADVLGVSFAVMQELNHTCWGAALCAGAAAGVLDDLATSARNAAKVRELVEPNPAATGLYRGLVEIYKDLYRALDSPFRALWERRQESSQRAGL